MKKNTMMRLASGLLVAVLLTTCAISGTFAKYVTSDSSTDSARVAKWGVNVDVVVDGAFATEYDAKETVTDLTGTAIAKTVVSSNGDNLLAPGTSGTLLSKAAITGSPEVAVNIKKVADLKLTGWTVDGAYYCPIVITIGTTELHGNNYTTAADFEAAVEAALAVDVNCQANANLAMDTTVAWEWKFVDGVGQDDAKDTALGNAALNGEIEIEFTYTVTVTQID